MLLSMRTTLSNQKGFSAVEAIVILVVVALLGLGGWFVWQSNKDDKPKESSSTSKNKTNTDADADSVELTTKLTSHNNLFSLLLPGGWKFTNDTELDYAHAIGLENMQYKAGTSAVVVDEMGHRGGGITTAKFVIQGGSAAELGGYTSGAEEQGTFKTSGGLEGKKYLFTASEKHEELVPGTKVYIYEFVDGDDIVTMSYQKLPTDPDQLEIVEAAVKTFTFQ